MLDFMVPRATEERSKAADFITYSKAFDGVLVAKGNPKNINGINTSMCGATAAENTGFVEVPLRSRPSTGTTRLHRHNEPL
jgi:hypothetical protein